jgi:hypothetical protein
MLSARPSCFGGVLGKVENPIAERSFLRQIFDGAQPFVNCGAADPVHSELTARLRADTVQLAHKKLVQRLDGDFHKLKERSGFYLGNLAVD